jgi:hypothetical protein
LANIDSHTYSGTYDNTGDHTYSCDHDSTDSDCDSYTEAHIDAEAYVNTKAHDNTETYGCADSYCAACDNNASVLFRELELQYQFFVEFCKREEDRHYQYIDRGRDSKSGCKGFGRNAL